MFLCLRGADARLTRKEQLLNTATEKTPSTTTPVWVAGFMSGTSLDAVDAAMILTDGEKVTDFRIGLVWQTQPRLFRLWSN